MLAGGYVAPPLAEKLDAWHFSNSEDGPVPANVAAALAAQAMGFAPAVLRDEGIPLRELGVHAAPRAASPARLLSWTAPPLSPRKGVEMRQANPVADQEKSRSERLVNSVETAEKASFQDTTHALVAEGSRLPRPMVQVAIRCPKEICSFTET
ncbi:unnamed protein product [Durusdinium trenchii]|uniref:Uncharacterized protein n=1 Tax=Durusdinium trenchii TaxID=1381693 RepID=A0ABP0MM48_9DINO